MAWTARAVIAARSRRRQAPLILSADTMNPCILLQLCSDVVIPSFVCQHGSAPPKRWVLSLRAVTCLTNALLHVCLRAVTVTLTILLRSTCSPPRRLLSGIRWSLRCSRNTLKNEFTDGGVNVAQTYEVRQRLVKRHRRRHRRCQRRRRGPGNGTAGRGRHRWRSTFHRLWCAELRQHSRRVRWRPKGRTRCTSLSGRPSKLGT